MKLVGNKKGFTIIEVLIVLAIASLILLIIFMVVPTLQRNSRNTERKHEAERIASAIQNYLTTNSQLPSPADWTASSCSAIKKEAGTLLSYGNLTCFSSGGGFNVGYFSLVQSATGGGFSAVSDEALLYVNAPNNSGIVCGAPNYSTGQASANVGTSREQSALFYAYEKPSGFWIWQCLQAT